MRINIYQINFDRDANNLAFRSLEDVQTLTGGHHLTEEQAQRYKNKYLLPENFVRVNGEIEAIPFKPKDKSQER